jgi:putative transposase
LPAPPDREILAGCRPTTAYAAPTITDHRIREHICRTRNPTLYPYLQIPRSTSATWLRRGCPKVVSGLPADADVAALRERIATLDTRVARLSAVIGLQRALLRVAGVSLEDTRLPTGAHKATILQAVARARRRLPLTAILRILRVSPARYHAWQRAERACQLDDRSSCPRTLPAQLTPAEVATIKDFVTAEQYRHMPVSTLARYAQRIGKVFASATTWGRLVRDRGWRRPRRRVHPLKPTLGVRATRPNEYWHVDVTVIRPLPGVKVYLHAVIDNFSRRILAWRLAERLDPLTTCAVLLDAGRPITNVPTVVADSGSENVNGAVDVLVQTGVLRRVLALVEVSFSNSMIEAWWRSLRHQWLYLHALDSAAPVKRLIAFYVEQHNTVMPHAAFRGQTPDEMYFGTGDQVPLELAAAHRMARTHRLAKNRAARCATCVPTASAVTNRSPATEALQFR